MADTCAWNADTTTRANDRNLLTSALTDLVGVTEEQLPAVFALVDRWEKYDRDKLAAQAEEIGLADKQFEKLGDVLGSGTALLDELPAQVKETSNLVKVLSSSAASLVHYDPMIVRGLAYYTSTVFEVFDTSPENNRALFGGGAYSDLAGLFTSTPLELRKLGKELTRADKAGARAVVIVGQEDWDAGNVTVRGLITREQLQVAVDSAPATVANLLAG